MSRRSCYRVDWAARRDGIQRLHDASLLLYPLIPWFSDGFLGDLRCYEVLRNHMAIFWFVGFYIDEAGYRAEAMASRSERRPSAA